jgi:tetratricopeptide (TPR) repeat protein
MLTIRPDEQVPTPVLAGGTLPIPAGSGTQVGSQDAPPPQVAASLLSRPTIPGYEVHDEIARGGMGAVLAARELVLDREVAIKVLLPGADATDAARRFVTESKITARLPHPGIPPVHTLGELPDGSPFLAMKLIRGRTLAALLAERPDPSAELPRFVRIFDQVCQAVAFAHAQRIIHRDLKPGNVMVGAFGEVQVMDWGLAKDLASGRVQSSRVGEAVDEDGRVQPGRSPGLDSPDLTADGAVMGTPAYMAPEQARGESVDERADVFALGAILCAILTGEPPYGTGEPAVVLLRAAGAMLDPCRELLDGCEADVELVGLAKRCLAPIQADRPVTAGEVARLVSAFRAAVEERLRRVEAERAAAEAKAIEQRKKRRVQAVLAVAVVALLGLVVTKWLDRQQDTVRNNQAGELLLDQCKAALEIHDTATAAIPLAEAEKRLAEGGATHLRDRLALYQADLDMLRELDRIDDERWTPLNGALQVAYGRAEWPKAFDRYGMTPGRTDRADAARRIQDSPIRERLLAALDLWFTQDPSDKLLAFLRAVDPDTYRDAVRDALLRRDDRQLQELAARPAAAEQPARFCVAIGELTQVPRESREKFLHAAYWRNTRDLSVVMTLGRLYPLNEPETASVRAGWFQAAVSIRRGNAAAWANLAAARGQLKDLDGAIACSENSIRLNPNNVVAYINLGQARRWKNQQAKAAVAFRQAIRVQPTCAEAHYDLGQSLLETRDLDGATTAFREAGKLEPHDPHARFALGRVLLFRGDRDGAIAAVREAIKLGPTNPIFHQQLGDLLHDNRDSNGAIASYREAIRLDPKNVSAHISLGAALRDNADLDGAITVLREATRLAPTNAAAHHNLGNTLTDKNDLDGAIRSCREAIRLDPNNARAHNSLGIALGNKGDSEAAAQSFREAIRIDPNYAGAHTNLGVTYYQQKRYSDAIASTREATRLDPKDPHAYRILGNALLQMGDVPGGRAAFTEAARLDPKLAPLLKRLPPVPLAPPQREVKVGDPQR